MHELLRLRRDIASATATATSSTTTTARCSPTQALTLCGQSPDGHIVEAVELSDHRFFVGVQFHPEFKSRPNRAHPLFKALVESSLKK